MTVAGKVAGQARSLLPDPLFYRGIAASYRLRRERRMLFLDELVANGSVVVDVGAWWGPWTYWLSRRAAEVWSFEPNPDLAAFLTGVVSPNVRVENIALSDHSGTEALFAPEAVGRDALATLSNRNKEAGARRFEVQLRTLDDYRLKAVHFIKIDVEGHELEVLNGAEGTIRHCAPTLLIEIDQAFHERPIKRVFDWLLDRGYEGRFRRGGQWLPLGAFDVNEDQSTDRGGMRAAYINDFLFTPVTG